MKQQTGRETKRETTRTDEAPRTGLKIRTQVRAGWQDDWLAPV